MIIGQAAELPGLAIMVLYRICFLLWNKHRAVPIAALVLFVLDTLFPVWVCTIGNPADLILDGLFHIYVLYYLIQGVRTDLLLRKQAPKAPEAFGGFLAHIHRTFQFPQEVFPLPVDKTGEKWYYDPRIREKARMGRVRRYPPVREPRLVGWGAERAAEHGPGAVRPKAAAQGRAGGVRYCAAGLADPIRLRSREAGANQGGTAVIPAALENFSGAVFASFFRQL